MYILQHFSNIAAIYSLDQSSQYAMQLHYVLKLEKIFFNVPVFWVLEKAITNKNFCFSPKNIFHISELLESFEARRELVVGYITVLQSNLNNFQCEYAEGMPIF